MNKAVCILGIVVMVAKGTLTPSVSVRCRNPQPDFKETVSVNGTTIWADIRRVQKTNLKFVGFIAYGFESRSAYHLRPKTNWLRHHPFTVKKRVRGPPGAPRGVLLFGFFQRPHKRQKEVVLMAEPKVIRSEINRKLTTIACECESRMAKLRKPLITVKY